MALADPFRKNTSMKNSHKLIKTLFLAFIFISCNNDLGLVDIPKYLSDKKWGNPADGSRFALINDIKVHYRDQGPKDAPVIVAIHGVADSLHVWEKVSKELRHDFRFIRLDVPGFGLSDGFPDRVYTVKKWIEVINGLMAQLKVEQFYLMGNSLGGYISWNYALSYPEQVKSLFLIAPAAFPLAKAPWIVELAGYYPIRQITLSTTPRILVKKAVYDVYGDDSKVTSKIVDRYYELMLRKGNRDSYMDVFRRVLAIKNVYPNELVDLKTKTMVVFGDMDAWIPPEQLKQWEKEVPHVKTKLYHGVGHTPQAESPQIIIDDFLDFIHSS